MFDGGNMKFRRIFITILIAVVAFGLAGCGNQNTEKAVAGKIEKNANNLDMIIQKLDDLNYDDIVIDDISPLADSTFNTVSNTSNLSKTKFYSVGNGKTVEVDFQKSSQNKYANARYVNSDKINIKNTNQKTNFQNENNQIEYNSNSYVPKYVNQVSDSFTRDKLNNYIKEIEVIYGYCADCIGCNTECRNQTNLLRQNIEESKTLAQKLKDGTIQLEQNEIASCNQNLEELNNLCNRLSSTKNNVNQKEKDVENLKDNLTNNLESLKNAYNKLLLALESRLDYLKECNQKICTVCDIINKTNVDVDEAKQNRSDLQDIVYDNQYDIENENNNENGILNGEQNDWTYQNTSSVKKNFSQLNSTKKYDMNNQKDVINQYNKKDSQNNDDRYKDNVTKTPVFENGNRFGNQNANNPYQNNQSGYYQNGFPNYNQSGYGINNPYPYRNIDTYRNIVKNTDTYSPNYYYNPNANNYNNQPFVYGQSNTQNGYTPYQATVAKIDDMKDLNDEKENIEKESVVKKSESASGESKKDEF